MEKNGENKGTKETGVSTPTLTKSDRSPHESIILNIMYWGILCRDLENLTKTHTNRPNSQIPECTCSISHNAPLRAEMCTFLFWMEHCGIWNMFILGFVKLVYHCLILLTRFCLFYTPWETTSVYWLILHCHNSIVISRYHHLGQYIVCLYIPDHYAIIVWYGRSRYVLITPTLKYKCFDEIVMNDCTV